MNNKLNYLTWFVPLEIAQELKEIGFDCPCSFFYKKKNNNDFSLCLNTIDDEINIGGVDYKNTTYIYSYLIDELNNNKRDLYVSAPTWDDTLAWFRAKGYKITFKDINIGTQCAFYHLDIKEGHTFSYFAKKYEKAREGLVMKLIEVHKEFGNNIKRK